MSCVETIPMKINSSWVVHLILALGFQSQLLRADGVIGSLTLDGKQHAITKVIAVRVASSFVGGTLVTRMALSDAALTPEQLRTTFGVTSAMKQGPLHGITLEFSDDRSYASLNLFSTDHKTSVSMSGTMESLKLRKHSPQEVAGTLKMEERKFGELRFALDLEFEVAVARGL